MKIIRHKICKYHMRDIIFINKCRKIFLKFGIYIILLGLSVLVALLPNVIHSKEYVAQPQIRYASDLKYILYWKEAKRNKKNFINGDEIYEPGQKDFIAQNCPLINCFLTYNKSLLYSQKAFDAIVFNIRDIRKLKVQNVNLRRSPHQRYIFKSFNSAEKHPICNPLLDNFFNWTWTYRLDSDIPHPFINIINFKHVKIGPRLNMKWNDRMQSTNKYKDKIKLKTKAVAWYIPNCKLKYKHQDFIKDLMNELREYNYTLDTYGACGNSSCGKTELHSDSCYKQIENNYYFQLVLEDSVAQDYVTETLAKAMLHVTVPIVLGKNFSSFLPPGSYINAGSFELNKLGAIIDYLIKNPEKYSSFFDWKSYFYYSARPRSYICDLCIKLNERSRVQTYSNLRHWWKNDFKDQCESIRLYNMFHTV